MRQEETIIDSRKESHLDLAFKSQNNTIDDRFYYEPMLSAHPDREDHLEVKFGNKRLLFPIWISSMTGGSVKSGPINRMLAKTARKFGLGMGLGSCRILLQDNSYWDDFNLRPILGDEVPFYANLGIAQIEQLLESGAIYLVKKLIKNLNVDGLIVHVNPLQEWLQPEGDRFKHAPIDTIEKLLNEVDCTLMVKEVGQGFGIESMKALLRLPLLAIDFAANGGTNFSKLELLRNPSVNGAFLALARLGHAAEEMVGFLNTAAGQLGEQRKCGMAIISGGIKSFLDGYYLMAKCQIPAIYAQASAFLYYAKISQDSLDDYVRSQIDGLLLSKAFLKLKQ